MDLKKEAEGELREYEAKRSALCSLLEEIAQLKAEAYRPGGASNSVPVNGGGSVWEDRQINLLMKREKMEAALQYVQDWVRKVERGLTKLDDEQRLVLDRFYMNPARGNVDRLCEELCLEKTAVYNRRDAALRKYTIARWGCVEV